MTRKERITKEDFHARGGFNNPRLFRQQTRGGAWRYYVRILTGVRENLNEQADVVGPGH